MASGGYPGAYASGKPIAGLDRAEATGLPRGHEARRRAVRDRRRPRARRHRAGDRSRGGAVESLRSGRRQSISRARTFAAILQRKDSPPSFAARYEILRGLRAPRAVARCPLIAPRAGTGRGNEDLRAASRGARHARRSSTRSAPRSSTKCSRCCATISSSRRCSATCALKRATVHGAIQRLAPGRRHSAGSRGGCGRRRARSARKCSTSASATRGSAPRLPRMSRSSTRRWQSSPGKSSARWCSICVRHPADSDFEQMAEVCRRFVPKGQGALHRAQGQREAGAGAHFEG